MDQNGRNTGTGNSALAAQPGPVPERKYTAPYTPTQRRHAFVGMVFIDKGEKMRIVRVGEPYDDGCRVPAFDAWAVPVKEQQ